MSRILIVTPAPARSRAGNRVTAERWARMLRSLGHRVQVKESWQDSPCDVLVALHARKSAATVERFARQQPQKPIVVALTGTDLYRDIRFSKAAHKSLALATRLVMLQPHGRRELPKPLHSKVRVIYQSAVPSQTRLRPLKDIFEVAVSGHLRPVKDPFRAALAARRLPAASKIRITHLGAALSDAMQRRARAEMARNPRYYWMGDVPRWRARQLLARSRLLVVSSKMEGGPNVISEALVASVPVLASRISGARGLLGTDYQGYFEVGDTAGLARLLQRCEQETEFYRQLQARCRRQSALFTPSHEVAAWRSLIDELA